MLEHFHAKTPRADFSPENERRKRCIKLYNWAYETWNRGNSDASLWREMLLDAMDLKSNVEDIGGIGYVASCCLRDHIDELSEIERNWCIKIIMDEFFKDYTTTDSIAIVSSNSFRADRPAAIVLPKLLNFTLNKTDHAKIPNKILLGLLHPVHEVQYCLAIGIGCYLYNANFIFFMECINLIIFKQERQTTLIKNNRKYISQGKTTYQKLAHENKEYFTNLINNNETFPQANLTQLKFNIINEIHTLKILLYAFSEIKQCSIKSEFFYIISEFLVISWHEDSQHRGSQNYEFNNFCLEKLTNFVLESDLETAFRTCSTILKVFSECPKGIADFIKKLIYQVKKLQCASNFWLLWNEFATKFLASSFISNLDEKYNPASEILKYLFLNIGWNTKSNHWNKLDENNYRIDSLIKKLPGSIKALKAYCIYLYNIGIKSLPEGFLILSSQLNNEIKIDEDFTSYLEELLARYIYGNPAFLKARRDIQDAIISLLDYLINYGSSAAYKMRDDFITPLPKSMYIQAPANIYNN